MKLRELVALASVKLRDSGIENYTRDARALCAFALGIRPDQVSFEANQHISGVEHDMLLSLINKRCEKMPVSRIIGYRLFWGRRFKINQHVLDPRGDTETLIELALKKPANKVLDLGTGTGNLAITLLCEWPQAHLVATDVSSEALSVARRNAEYHQVSERLDLTHSDWFEKIFNTFDLIVANPPYIAEDKIDELADEVKRFDPMIALTSGKDALNSYRKIARGAFERLEIHGRLILEIGSLQGLDVKKILAFHGFKQISVHKDFENHDRVVSCIRE